MALQLGFHLVMRLNFCMSRTSANPSGWIESSVANKPNEKVKVNCGKCFAMVFNELGNSIG